jgi:hypothetical protein
MCQFKNKHQDSQPCHLLPQVPEHCYRGYMVTWLRLAVKQRTVQSTVLYSTAEMHQTHRHGLTRQADIAWGIA